MAVIKIKEGKKIFKRETTYKEVSITAKSKTRQEEMLRHKYFHTDKRNQGQLTIL